MAIWHVDVVYRLLADGGTTRGTSSAATAGSSRSAPGMIGRLGPGPDAARQQVLES